MPDRITLKKAWHSWKSGTVLDVLQPGEAIRPNAVDAGRAATLLEFGIAELPAEYVVGPIREEGGELVRDEIPAKARPAKTGKEA